MANRRGPEAKTPDRYVKITGYMRVSMNSGMTDAEVAKLIQEFIPLEEVTVTKVGRIRRTRQGARAEGR